DGLGPAGSVGVDGASHPAQDAPAPRPAEAPTAGGAESRTVLGQATSGTRYLHTDRPYLSRVGAGRRRSGFGGSILPGAFTCFALTRPGPPGILSPPRS